MRVHDLIVIKFGGTALATPRRIRRAAARVRAQVRVGRDVVVVVSAAGRGTDRLLARALSVANSGTSRPSGPGAREGLGRELDRILATGENRSAGLLALALHGLGISARSLSGGEAGISVSGDFGSGSIEGVSSTPLRALLADGIVPVVSGFQGDRPDGELLTLGRGGSDITAVALAAALGAGQCHIVTDVDAVYDRDPRYHADARPFTQLCHAELVALADSGASVMHPRAARLAFEHGLPLYLYGYRAPLFGDRPPASVGGTWIGVASGEPINPEPQLAI